MQEIYDVVTKQTILLEKGNIMKLSQEMGVDYTGFFHLIKRGGHFMGRYILPESKNKIFTLVDLDTGQEFDCITNKTIFLYFNTPSNNNNNESKYINRMKKGRQGVGNICGRVLYLKSNGYPKIAKTNIKNQSIKVKERVVQIKIRKKIYSSLLKRIIAAVQNVGKEKLNKTEELIGCRVNFFLGYLEAKFTQGMTWDSYGEWHIDHIKPCNSFDLTNIEQQKKCFHYTNLRPLWATTKTAMKYGESENYIGNLNRNKDGSN